MINRLYIDLETLPDLRLGARERIAETISAPASMSKPETIAKWEAEQKPAAIELAWRKTSFDGGKGKIAVIGWATNDDDAQSEFSEKDWATSAGEVGTIKSFFVGVDKWLANARASGNSVRPQLIGHNLVAFDLRFLWRRCVVLGIKPPHWLPVNPKPWDDVVYDTMTAWAGLKDHVSMDSICESLGIPLKGSEFTEGQEPITGATVWDAVRDGRIADAATYCRADVTRTRAMHRRMAFID